MGVPGHEEGTHGTYAGAAPPQILQKILGIAVIPFQVCAAYLRRGHALPKAPAALRGWEWESGGCWRLRVVGTSPAMQEEESCPHRAAVVARLPAAEKQRLFGSLSPKLNIIRLVS